MVEMEQRSLQKPSQEETFEISADEGLSGPEPLEGLVDILKTQAARMPPD